MRNVRVGLRFVSYDWNPALQFRIPHSAFRNYSYRSASIGSREAARRAGQIPKNSPTRALKKKERITDSGESSVLQPATLASRLAPNEPKKIPRIPPTRHSTSASTRNWNRML